ncbi:MAG: hypothetical protein NZ902_06455 [Acidilobaceae archaeon]|nr:hypothetical protein [Acidilobaceae archaeon]
MSRKALTQVEDEVLWERLEKKWVELKFDPTLLEPIKTWAGYRKQTPLEVLLTVAHRALVHGINV